MSIPKTKILSFFLLTIIIFRLSLYLWPNYPASFREFDPQAYQRAYLGSTYALKGGAPISDYIVYGHAAWEYIHGKNPTLINPEMPPLGKYLMGLSILLFKRIAVGSLIFGLGSLVLVFLIGKMVLKSTLLSLIPLILLVFEPLFIKQLNTALLDIYHLFFILLAFYFFLLAQKKKKLFFFASLALGGVMATKFYSTGVVIAFSWIVYLLLNKDRQGLLNLLTSLPLAILVLALSYLKIFLEGESLRRFFGIQKWMFHFHSQGKFLVPPGAIWQLIFLKKWITWWGDRRPLPAPDWQITWPISVAGSLIFGAISMIESIKSKFKLKEEVKILLIWVMVYVASLSFGIIYPRYLLPLLPFTYILSILAIKAVIRKLLPAL